MLDFTVMQEPLNDLLKKIILLFAITLSLGITTILITAKIPYLNKLSELLGGLAALAGFYIWVMYLI